MRAGSLGRKRLAGSRASSRVRVPLRERVDVVEGVERLSAAVAPAGRALYWATVHFVDGVLVDSGPAHARPALLRFLAARPLALVLTTHGHEDHVGNHEALPAGTRVLAPAATLPLLDSGPSRIPFYRRVTWGMHGPAPGASALGETVETPRGTWRVIPTPGHSDDHVSFFDEDAGAVYTGDAYLGKFKAARDVEDVHTGLASLRRLAELEPAILYPGHGPALHRPRARLLDTVEHFESLARRAHALAARGARVKDIRRELLGREPFLTYISAGEFSAEKLIENLLRRTC